jgi:hypothetical protein
MQFTHTLGCMPHTFAFYALFIAVWYQYAFRVPSRESPMYHRLTIAFAFVASLAVSTAAFAEAVVLTVRASGLAAGSQSFTMAELDALPQIAFTTSTVWTDGKREFRGASVKALLDALGVKGKTVKARALNGYVVDIPVASLEAEAPIIASRIDGALFPRREKGPLWIIYPYDSSTRFQTETVYGRSIWQLHELLVE